MPTASTPDDNNTAPARAIVVSTRRVTCIQGVLHRRFRCRSVALSRPGPGRRRCAWRPFSRRTLAFSPRILSIHPHNTRSRKNSFGLGSAAYGQPCFSEEARRSSTLPACTEVRAAAAAAAVEVPLRTWTRPSCTRSSGSRRMPRRTRSRSRTGNSRSRCVSDRRFRLTLAGCPSASLPHPPSVSPCGLYFTPGALFFVFFFRQVVCVLDDDGPISMSCVMTGGEKISTVRSKTWCQFPYPAPLLVHRVGR